MAGKKLTKSQFVAAVAEKCDLTKTQTGAFLDAINDEVVGQLGKKGPGEVVLPGLLKLTVVEKPAVPERQDEPSTRNCTPATAARPCLRRKR